MIRWTGATALARWLGPWADPAVPPPCASVRTVSLRRPGGRPFEGRWYRPSTRPRGAYLICPGLHPAGPSDPRMDRLARALAAAGFEVLSPGLPDHLEARLTLEAVADAAHALHHLRDASGFARPSLFGISFGGLAALSLAGTAPTAGQVAGVVLFGAYADYREAIRFVVTRDAAGRAPSDPDPLPLDPRLWPVALLNVPDLGLPPPQRATLDAAWVAALRAGWALDDDDAAGWWAVVDRVEPSVPEALRPLFRSGCGAGDDPGPRVLAAMAADPDRCDALTPLSHVAGLRVPVVLAHGADDGVTHVAQLRRLEAALAPRVPVETYVTGLFSHATVRGLTDLGRAPRALGREVGTLWGLARAIDRVGRLSGG